MCRSGYSTIGYVAQAGLKLVATELSGSLATLKGLWSPSSGQLRTHLPLTRPRRRLCAYVSGPVTTASPSSLYQATSLPQLSLQLLRRAPGALAFSPEVSKKLHLPTGSVALSFLPRSPTPDPWQRRDVRGPGAAVSASLPGARAGAGRRHPEPFPPPFPPGLLRSRRSPECQGRARAWPLRAREGSRPRRARPPGAAAASRSARARARSRPRPRALRGRRGQ